MEDALERRELLRVGRRAALVEAVEAGELPVGLLLAQQCQPAALPFRADRKVAAPEIGAGKKHRGVAGGDRAGEAEMQRLARLHDAPARPRGHLAVAAARDAGRAAADLPD